MVAAVGGDDRLEAAAEATRVFASGGYVVVVDGIVGPWNLDIFRESLGRTGAEVTVQNSEVHKINKEQYEAGKNTAPAAPWTSNAFTALALPVREHVIRAVSPLGSVEFASAPAARSRSTIAALRLTQAR